LDTAGTPERPLSDLGLGSYTHFWLGAIIRHLRACAKPDEPVHITIDELASACAFRRDDVVHTLIKTSLAKIRRRTGEPDHFSVSMERVEQIAAKFKIKRKILEERFLCL
jgi:hypothetical protein